MKRRALSGKAPFTDMTGQAGKQGRWNNLFGVFLVGIKKQCNCFGVNEFNKLKGESISCGYFI